MLDEEVTLTERNIPALESMLQVLLRRLPFILLIAVAAMGSAWGFSLYQTPTYEASVKILVGQKGTDSANLSGDVEGLQQLAVTLAKAVPTQPVAQAVVEQPGLPEGSAKKILENLSAQQDPGTFFIDVSYQDSSPKRTQLIANAIGQVFSQKVSEMSLGASTATATVWEQATLPEAPVAPNPLRNAILAFVFGLPLGAGLAFLLEYVDNRWNSPEEVELARKQEGKR